MDGSGEQLPDNLLVLTTEKAEVVLLPDVHVFHRQVPWLLGLQLFLPL